MDSARDVKVSPDGKYLFVVNSDRLSASYLRVFSLASPASPKPVGRALRLASSAKGLAIAPNGRVAAISMYNSVALVNVTKPSVPTLISRVSTPFDVRPVTFSRGSGLVYAGGDLHAGYAIIDASRHRVQSTRTFFGVTDDVSDLEVSSDNTLLWLTTTSRSEKNSIYAFDMTSARVQFAAQGVDYPSSVAVSRAGSTRGQVYFGSGIYGYMCAARQSPA